MTSKHSICVFGQCGSVKTVLPLLGKSLYSNAKHTSPKFWPPVLKKLFYKKTVGK